MRIMGVDPKRLRDLAKIIELGSFTRAAEALRVSQPALSNSIHVLEHNLGVQLLTRDKRGATGTEFGEVLAVYARALESLLNRADEDIQLKKMGVEGTLTVGVTPIAATEIVPEVVSRLLRQTPRVLITVIEEVDDQLMSDLKIGKLDLVVGPVGVEPRSTTIHEEALVRDPFAVIMRPGHPLANSKVLKPSVLDQAAWVMPTNGTSFRRQIEGVFSLIGVSWPAHCVFTNSATAVKGIVSRSDYLAIMSRHLATVEIESGRLVHRPVERLSDMMTLGVKRLSEAPISPLIRRFSEMLRAVAGESYWTQQTDLLPSLKSAPPTKTSRPLSAGSKARGR